MRIFYFAALFLCLFSEVAYGGDIKRRAFNFGFVTPVSTNGMDVMNTVNAVSLNLLGGCSYANEYFELGGFYNVNRHHTLGVSVAGLFSYSGCLDRTFQVSGLFNYGNTGTSFLQLGGIMNRSQNVRGVQIGGILNVARNLRGLQIGLVNVVEESDYGVSLGLINIVRKNGKMDLALSFSDFVNTSVDFRLGKDNFYTIFSGGLVYVSSPLEYSAGIGFGSGFRFKRGLGCYFEALVNSLTSGGNFTTEMRMNPQFRLMLDVKLNKRFSVHFGPSFNLMVKDKENPAELPFPEISVFESVGDKYSTNGWVGFNIGLGVNLF